jgi:hypothetical protein
MNRRRSRSVAGLFLAILVAPGLLAACGTATPPAIAPTFDAWRAIGLACGQPAKGNEPTTLVQWRCQGTVEQTPLTVVVDGDDRGIHDLTAQVAPAVPDTAAMTTFRALISVSPYLSSARDGIEAWLAGHETIGEDVTTIGGQFAHLTRDPTWVTLSIAATS